MRSFATDTGRRGSLYVSADVRRRLEAGQGVRVEEIWPSLFGRDVREREERHKREVELRANSAFEKFKADLEALQRPIIERCNAVTVLFVKDAWTEYFDERNWCAEAVENLFGPRPSDEEVQEARSHLKAVREATQDAAPVEGPWERQYRVELDRLNSMFIGTGRRKEQHWKRKKTPST